MKHRSARVHIVLRRSRQAVGWIVVLTLSTALLLWTLPWPWWIVLPGDLALFFWAWLMFRQHARRTALHAVTAFTLSADRRLQLHFFSDEANADPLSVQVLEKTFVGAALIVVVWRTVQMKRDRSLFLLPDMMDAEEWRKLCVLLRHGWNKKPLD